MVYRTVFSLVLRRLDAERAHRLAFVPLRILEAAAPLRRLSARLLAPRDPALRVRVWDLEIPGPLGLAAGFDKNAEAYAALGAMGFGFVEVGTVTALPQEGNPRPRMFRLPADLALLNRLGFNNGGSTAAAARLARRRRGPGAPIVGVNIGKSKLAEDPVADYVISAERVAPHADYVVVNVSSPNTPGLRDLQAVEHLRPLLTAVREALDRTSPHRRVPLLVKVAPDMADDDLDAVADLALELGLEGIVATNTTVSRAGLSTPGREVESLGAGGISGAPLKARALEVLERLHHRTAGRLVLIGVGGISTAEDVQERLAAGATLVQAYSAVVYGGPLWASRTHRELRRLLPRTPDAAIDPAAQPGRSR